MFLTPEKDSEQLFRIKLPKSEKLATDDANIPAANLSEFCLTKAWMGSPLFDKIVVTVKISVVEPPISKPIT